MMMSKHACILEMAIDRTAHAVLTEIIHLEELKRSTDVTKNVLATVHKLARLQTDEERTIY